MIRWSLKQQHAPGHQLYKAVVAHQIWERFAPMGQYRQGVEILKGSGSRAMKGNDKGHHFT
jgi:hypothetical protein